VSRELLEEDDVALEAWLDALSPLDANGRLDVKALAGKPRAVIRRALYRWIGLQKDTGDLSRQGFALLLAMLEQGRATRFSLGSNGFAVIRKGWLFFEKAPRRR
jgi:tRNA(Ile)-lysidine synthase